MSATSDGLISAFLDNELDDAGHQSLEAWLLADRDNQRRFLGAVMDHRALTQQLQAERHPTVRRQRVRSGRRPVRLGNPWAFRAMALAALVMLAIGGALWWRSDSPGPRLIHLGFNDVPSQSVAWGEHLAPKDHDTELLYGDGTRVTVRAGCEVLVEDSSAGKRITVVVGRLSATVAPQPAGKPFAFATPNSLTTVLGTSLTVETDGVETDIAVEKGRVTVQRLTDHATVEVASGERSTVATDLPLRARADAAPAGQLYRVGRGQAIATIADLPALAPGDVVELQAGTHAGAWRLLSGGTRLRPITIRGAAGELPLIDSAGLYLSGEGSVPRAALQVHDGHWRIEHLRFANARNREHAAAVRSVESQSVSIRDCHIAHCDIGIIAVANDVAISHCTVGFCGTSSNEGFGRDISIIAQRALVRDCYLHDQLHGQSLRSTCGTITVDGCRIANASDGEITLVTGAKPTHVTLTANVIISSPNRSGENKMRFILPEGNGHGTLALYHNTCIADNGLVTFLAPTNLAVTANHNLFFGKAQIALPGSISGRGNWLPESAVAPPGFVGTLVGSNPGFVDAAAGDYSLRADTTALTRSAPGAARPQP